MDEEKQQSDSIMRKAGDALKTGIKNQAKKSKSLKNFFKVIKAIKSIAPILILVVTLLLVTIVAISDFLDKIKGDSSKNANAFAVHYAGVSSGEENEDDEVLNKIIIDTSKITNDGAYILTYEFKDEDGNLYTEEQALENIKKDLLEENPDLKIIRFSESELKIIGVLMYNGLQVEKYNEEELQALALFVKADIASQNFDMRKQKEIGKEIDLDEIAKTDYVYGTLQIHRTKAVDEYNNKDKENYTSETPLEFIPYGDESTANTFCYMKKNSDIDILNKFSIDEDGNVVFAKYSSLTKTYTYKNEAEEILTEKEIEENVSKDNIFENRNEIYISIVPIKYKPAISGFVINYGFLSDLLTITQNEKFCLDLAQQAFNSKLVINIKEELTISESTQITTYSQSKLIYDYVDYEVTGQKENSSSSWIRITSKTGAPSASDIPASYGWSSSLTPVSNGGNSTTYEWTLDTIKYRLEYRIVGGSNEFWILYKQNETITKEDLTSGSKTNELINLNNNHITETYSDYTIDEDYTKQEVFVYKVEEYSYSESTSCPYEVSEIDSWYLKKHKQYEEAVEEPIPPIDRTGNYKGQFPEEATEVLTTEDQSEIKKYQEVKDFIKIKENEFQSNNSVKKATCNIKKLTIKEKVKIDENETFHSDKKTYKFEEEIADTTEVQRKNIEFVNNVPTFTKVDSEGNEEIGFLYIYDKYRSQGIDLFLQNDAEKRLFELLESDETTKTYSEIIKFLLYAYDGIDRGVTELDLPMFNLSEFNSIGGLRGNTLADKIWYTLRNLGYSKASVAGVLGNLDYESGGLNADCVEAGTGIGIGLAQWSYGRREALESYALSKGVDWTDEDTQIEVLVDEIDGQGKYTNGFITNHAFLEVTYNGKKYNRNVWKDVDEEDIDFAIEEATTAFCVSWERPLSPSSSLSERNKRAVGYYEYYKDKEYGGTYTTEGCYGHVRAKFISQTGRTHLILQQTETFLKGQCNRAACMSITSGYMDPDTPVDFMVNDFNNSYDQAYFGAIPSNSAYWNNYGLEVTNAYAGESTTAYMDSLEMQLNEGGYALIWLNDAEQPYFGKSGTQWSQLYHWIAILGIKYEDGKCLIAASTSGNGKNDWINIDEFTSHGVTHMVFVNPIK